MLPVSFDNIAPKEVVWVAPGGRSGDGSSSAPYATIQQAIDAARAGTAIMARAGTYNENVLIQRDTSGTPGAPIWLISVDGPQRAHIVAPDNSKLSAITAGGVQNFVVQGFWITGGKNGIQFSQDGYGFDKMIRNIVIRGNRIENTIKDGIKVNGGENVFVDDNETRMTNDEGIDFVAIVHGSITNNDVGNNTGPDGIFAKGGSQDILIAKNHVHDVSADGIAIGGYMNPKIPYRKGYDSFEAKDVSVLDNRVERVGKRPLNVLGGVDSVATGNYFEASPHYPAVVGIGTSYPRSPKVFKSSNIRITGNVITRADRQISVTPGSGAVTFTRNIVGQTWNGRAGVVGQAIPMPLGALNR